MSGFCYILQHKYNQLNIYVGSTNHMKRREWEHKKCCNKPNDIQYNEYKYIYIRKHGGINQWNMTKIYEGLDYKLFEKNYIKSTWKYNVNVEIPMRTNQELKDYRINYNKKNKDSINEKQREKYQANKDSINERQREKYQVNKYKINEKIPCSRCGKHTIKRHMVRHKKSKSCLNFLSRK